MDEIDDLETHSLNCVRGSATQALSALLWADYGRYELLKQSIADLVCDNDPAVGIAILEAVIATYNIDKEQSRKSLVTIVTRKVRLALFSTVLVFYCRRISD